MRRIFDPTHEGIDVLFRDNNRLDCVQWQDDDASAEQCTDMCLRAMSQLAELWLPARYTVTLANLEHDGPGSLSDTVVVDIEAPGGPGSYVPEPRDAVVAGLRRALDGFSGLGGEPWMLKSIETSLAGWSRVAVPGGADVVEPWFIVSPDGLGPQPYELRDAPRVAGQDTVWLRLSQAMAATHMALSQHLLGDAEMRTSLGITFFQPGNDPRPPDHQVRGQSLSAWQQANTALYSDVFDRLRELGWHALSRS